ncbi:hypothetical protein FIBSPDRAFT_939054 [Athelia psychrophila]|uniref:Carbamoyl phosphate synthase ATP-binding domain-containing protein n=1 Tax=Athelia psychrophila TaxID=1759441 RepID=A0A165XAP9_9AGAM|nr:hypothetical protein FIBSPDRAFT_939054 [Fibularhizoctonia sp. CBS 109695]
MACTPGILIAIRSEIDCGPPEITQGQHKLTALPYCTAAWRERSRNDTDHATFADKSINLDDISWFMGPERSVDIANRPQSTHTHPSYSFSSESFAVTPLPSSPTSGRPMLSRDLAVSQDDPDASGTHVDSATDVREFIKDRAGYTTTIKVLDGGDGAMAPSTIPWNLVELLLAVSVKMARGLRYQCMGTFEYLVNSHIDQWAFLEINPCIQGEHTVTAPPLQLRHPNFNPAIIGPPQCCATQLRLTAEDPAKDLRLSSGAIRPSFIAWPAGRGVRVDTWKTHTGVKSTSSPVFSTYSSLPVADPKSAKDPSLIASGDLLGVQSPDPLWQLPYRITHHRDHWD